MKRLWSYNGLLSQAAARALVWLLISACILIFGGRYCVGRYIDFPVYWHSTQSLLGGRRDLYDPSFSWGGPIMDYRYPPLFLFLFVPLGLLPYKVAGYIWFALKFAALVVVLQLGYRMVDTEIRNRIRFWLVPFFIALPYFLADVYYGNAHFLIVLLIMLTFYWYETGHQSLSALALASSITVKAFPILLLLYFILKRKIRYASLVLLFVVVLNLLPAFHFGLKENFSLLATWYDHVIVHSEFHELNNGTNHSLKGVLQRYFSHFPYENRIEDRDYKNINVLNLSAGSVRVIWYVAEALIALLIGYISYAHAEDQRPEQKNLCYGFITCALVGFGPWTLYPYFDLLLFPSMAISAYLDHAGQRKSTIVWILVSIAILLSFVPPLIPGRIAQRNIKVYSPYFFSAVMLFISFIVPLWPRKPKMAATIP